MSETGLNQLSPGIVGRSVLDWLDERIQTVQEVDKLTPRQVDFLDAMLANRWETKAASEAIGVSPKTGEIHWANARAQLGNKLNAFRRRHGPFVAHTTNSH